MMCLQNYFLNIAKIYHYCSVLASVSFLDYRLAPGQGLMED